MLKPIINPARGKLKVLGYCSGSGNTLWKAYELQKEMEKTPMGCPFEIVGIFADNPASKAVMTATELGVPWESIDLRKFYEDRNAPLKDRSLRAQYDARAIDLLEKYQADVILLAGYVWATTDIILDHYLVLNVHPADLAVLNEEGKRALAGANGIKAAFDLEMDYLRSSSHIATKELDAGPLLVRSPKIPIDYTLHSDYDSRFKHYLKLVNDQSRQVGARTLLELSLGHFSVDEFNMLHYKGKPMPQGLTMNSWEENKPNYQRNMSKFLNPSSIAIVGASSRPGIGQALIKNLQDMNYKGTIFAVNRKSEPVLGVNGYSSLMEIPESVEMAILSIPSSGILSVAEECGKKGVQSIVCITAGFREVGGDGQDREAELMKIVDRYNMRMIGPNCMGLANTDPDVNLSATILSNTPPPGHVAFLTQSGALGASLMDFADELDVGFSVIVSLGNMADVDPTDLLPLLEEDQNTHIICMYLESLPDPYRFEQAMNFVTKPVIAVKSGRTSAGAAAASSHTGSLASNDSVVDALLKKCGVIRVDSLEDAFLLASSLSKMPFIKGPRVGIISNAGGLGTLTADALIKYGFTLPELDADDQSALAQHLLPEASTHNPLDLVAAAPPQHYAISAKALIDSRKYDALIIDCVPPATVDTKAVGEALLPIIRESNLPAFSCFFGPTIAKGGRDVMKQGGIPTFNFPDQMVRTMHFMLDSEKYPEMLMPKGPEQSQIVEMKKTVRQMEPGHYLEPSDCFELLSIYGIPLAKSSYILAEQPASVINLEFPLVAKVDHPEIIHKSDVGGVAINLRSLEEVETLRQSWVKKFPNLRGIHLQEQIEGDLEMIIGAFKDPSLGHSIMTGLGGTLVEIFKDVSYGHVPLSTSDPSRMLAELKSKPLLEGYRGTRPANTDQFNELLMRVNRLLLDFPEIMEMDINPLIFDPSRDHFIAVDARVRIS